jgi:tRNA-2-methylthio-N6-dimethylallyladenosine synthase
MNRKYTRQIYLDRVDRLRRIRPDIAVTSDFIVGFPGESTADFEDTLALLETVAFDSIFAFMYSDREIAPASRFKTKIDENKKKDRLQKLLTTQEKITLAKNRMLVGTHQEIMVEGGSTRPGLAESVDEGPQWSGRTPGNKIVNFSLGGDATPAPPPRVGAMVDVSIEKAFSHSLRGALVRRERSHDCSGREECHAA